MTATPNAITIEGRTGVHFIGRADLILPRQEGEIAALTDWAEPHLHHVDRWDMGWMVGRYVHAERPNENGHIFPLADLQTYYELVPHTALDMMHREKHVVGAYVAAEMLWPKGVAPTADALGGDPPTPWVETLASVWRRRFPDEYAAIQQAHHLGVLAQSMECMPQTITCATCQTEFPYRGPFSTTYDCGHLATAERDTRRKAPKILNRPHFTGGGVVLPPGKPGWKDASIRQVAAMAEIDPAGADQLLAEVAHQFDHLDASKWEELMGAVLIAAGADVAVEKPTVVSIRRSIDGDATAKAEVNLRPSAHAFASCLTCTHHEAGDCTLVAEDDLGDATCNRWTPVEITSRPTEDAAQVSNGAMIAFYPPVDVAEQLAAMSGTTEAVDVQHVTVLYLGRADELAYTAPDAVRLVETIAAISKPFQARVQGLGRFVIPDGEAVVALIDAPGIGDVRERLFNLFDVAGYDPPNDHSYTPHLTLHYTANGGDGPAEVPPESKWTVDKLCVVWKGERFEVPLGKTATPTITPAEPVPA